jgi:ferredoxin-NADP reductase
VGITPFLSVLRHFRYRKATNRVVLFWSNKTRADIFCGDELGAMTGELGLTVVHCLSREENVEGYFSPATPRVHYEKGRLSAGILESHGVTRDAAFYLCGPPPMMEAALKELQTLGVDPAAVEEERFVWKK